MKIYTRTGDQGTTSLFGGDRIAKNHPRITAYGTVDELNALLGLVRTEFTGIVDLQPVDAMLFRIQNELFELGADLATPVDARPTVPRIESAHIDRLESDIDRLDKDLPALQTFILPGGTRAAAWLHVLRTVARRAERATVETATLELINEGAIRYLNRLSDLMFVMARWVNHQQGFESPAWTAPAPLSQDWEV